MTFWSGGIHRTRGACGGGGGGSVGAQRGGFAGHVAAAIFTLSACRQRVVNPLPFGRGSRRQSGCLSRQDGRGVLRDVWIGDYFIR